MSEKAPDLFEWTPESISLFWDRLGKSPLNDLSFSKLNGEYLVRHIQQYVGTDETILDFGAGGGDLAERLLGEGYKMAVYEPSPGRESSIAQRHLENFPNFLGRLALEEIQTRQLRFGAILLFEVLEHIHPAQFEQTLQTILSMLALQGKVIGTVPNNEPLSQSYCICPQCGVMFHRWQHMRSFDSDTLAKLLEELQFTKIVIYPASYSPSLFFYATRP